MSNLLGFRRGNASRVVVPPEEIEIAQGIPVEEMTIRLAKPRQSAVGIRLVGNACPVITSADMPSRIRTSSRRTE